MAGSSYDVGGHRLHLDCHGQAAPSGQTGPGGPTVILENGLGEMSASWARIIPAVARTTRVCALRPGGPGLERGSRPPVLGPDHPDLVAPHSNLGGVLYGLGDLAGARARRAAAGAAHSCRAAGRLAHSWWRHCDRRSGPAVASQRVPAG
jgi:hypothetical protein